METLFFYCGKVIITSAILFFYYRLFLKDKTFHHYNRFYLLSVIAVSIVLPLLKVNYFTIEVNSSIFVLLSQIQHINTPQNSDHEFFYYKISAAFIGLGIVFFLIRLMIGLIKIQILKKKFHKANIDGISFYQTNLEEAPFSYFKSLFWKNSIDIQSDLGRQILKHEMVHIEQKHSWDKIYAEVIHSLFWFNPIFYFIKKDLFLIHEYLADKKALKDSDTKAFAQMLLASHFSGKQFPAISSFFSSNLKKRLTMLKKSKTKFSYARRILALPLLFILSFLYLINAKNKEIKITNLEIENAISGVQVDTIKVNNSTDTTTHLDSAFGIDGTKVYEEHPELIIDNDTIVENNVHNSPEFKKRIKDAEKRAAEADRLVNSPAFKKRLEDAEKKAAEADRLVNSPAFKKRLEDAEKKATEADRLVNSPAFKKRLEDVEKKATEADRLVNSPAFKKRIEDAEKRAGEAERKLKYAEFKQSRNDSEIIAIESVNFKPNEVKKQAEKIDIIIDEKPSTSEEMKKLDPTTIESVHVYKKGFNGNRNAEIHIKLKK